MQRIPDDLSIFTVEAKAVDLALDFIRTCDTNNKFIIFSDSLSVLNAIKVSNGAKIRNRYNQVPHLTQDTNGKVTNSQKTPQTRANKPYQFKESIDSEIFREMPRDFSN